MRPNRVGASRFWPGLWKSYHTLPSIALCRIPELEYASELSLEGETLDHCCGDGIFAKLAWPKGKFSAGCDVSADAIEKAQKRNRHERCDVCDASTALPYEDATFDLVFNNSALEHIPNVDGALNEVARVLKPGGRFAFNVLNHRYFEWWPLDDSAMKDYRAWQPFIHAWSIDEWRNRLRAAGLEVQTVEGYFPKKSATILAQLDYEFSGLLLHNRSSALVEKYRGRLGIWKRLWQMRLERLPWRTAPDEGAGYFISATKP